MIRQSGEEPVIIEYLKNPPTRERLKELIAAMGASDPCSPAREGNALRRAWACRAKWTDDELLDFMMERTRF